MYMFNHRLCGYPHILRRIAIQNFRLPQNQSIRSIGVIYHHTIHRSMVPAKTVRGSVSISGVNLQGFVDLSISIHDYHGSACILVLILHALFRIRFGFKAYAIPIRINKACK